MRKSILIALLVLLGVSITFAESDITILTWNVRGYPEKEEDYRIWFSKQLQRINPSLLCIQEIANSDRVNKFVQEEGFRKYAFKDRPSDGQDNAIFANEYVEIRDIADPQGFQHLAQAAYVRAKGFDAVIITVHLSWSNKVKREQEKELLGKVITDMLRIDPDVIICGDFNIKEKEMEELSTQIGMEVMEPENQEGVGTMHTGNRYDYFLISPDLVSEEAQTCHIKVFSGSDLEIAKQVSDHLPVLAHFSDALEFSDWK